MAKDPAFLFYPNDYIGGTMGMTFEEKGAYIELLILQFNRGHMTSHMIGQTVGQLWDKIQDKFIQDDKGLWYNKRLDEEKIKRQNYAKSRRNNLKGKNQYTNNKSYKGGHMTSHMENENENEIENNNKDKKKNGKIKYGEFVLMTSEEYNKLVLQDGEEFTKSCIDRLDNYIGANGKRYKSHYRAILSWVRDAEKEKGDWNKSDINETAVIKRLRNELERNSPEEALKIFHGEARKIAEQKLTNWGY